MNSRLHLDWPGASDLMDADGPPFIQLLYSACAAGVLPSAERYSPFLVCFVVALAERNNKAQKVRVACAVLPQAEKLRWSVVVRPSSFVLHHASGSTTTAARFSGWSGLQPLCSARSKPSSCPTGKYSRSLAAALRPAPNATSVARSPIASTRAPCPRISSSTASSWAWLAADTRPTSSA